MTDRIQLDFCIIHVYENYMIVTVDTGVHITSQHNKILTEIATSHFINTRFVYITHRVNSYSVDPAVYKEVSKIDNLAGFCVVSKNFMAKSTAQIERLFLDKPFEIFDGLTEAISWAKSISK
ncbi:hypothetical protein [Psychroserpens sp. Hel_I_66]|uniref:hypothetical protein n=1 Tax=Psychroserpens sp. Hel_I_66 TaxID=1250004 RepID=UPI000645DF73|nr:hypothetical protein [Psychroserpens sp. Hel_I_66]